MLALVTVTFGIAVLVALRGAPPVRTAALRPPAPSGVTFGGVGYRLLGIDAAKTIRQPGAAAVTASGLFEIVRLGLQAADRRAHVVSSDLLALTAGGTYYGVSSPDVIGLNSKGWGALASATTVPASGVLTVKAVFDVPPAVVGRPLSLHIGQFDYVGQPGQILMLRNAAARGVPSPAVRRPAAPMPAALVPSPLLG